MQPTPASIAGASKSVSVTELFIGFLCLGLTSFGGALPFARRALVEKRGWLTAEAFTDLLGLCQFLPGGNVINLAVATGMRFQGGMGAVAAITGLIVGPSLVVIGLGILYASAQHNPHIHQMFSGIAAAAAGLLIAMAIKIARPLWHKRVAATIAVLTFFAIAVLKQPLLPTMLVLTPLSIWLASRGLATGSSE